MGRLRSDERGAILITAGFQIRAARAGLGWSQVELAKRAGVHEQSTCYWERQGAISPRQAQGGALEKMLAAFKSAGVEVTAEPRPAVFFDAQGRGLPPLLVAQGSP